jgi:hypothetical protein
MERERERGREIGGGIYKRTIFPTRLDSPKNLPLLIIEASRSFSDTPQSVGLLWTSDQPDAETSV